MIRETAAFLLVALAACAAGILLAKRHAPPPDFPLVASAVHANPQCAVPPLDYSKKPRRFDSRAIA